MISLRDFNQQIQARLATANREPYWSPTDAERYMADAFTRRQQFEQVARRLIESVIQPRLETLASHFTNASLVKDVRAGHAACRFGYCERFPASTRVEFMIEHDARFERLSIVYDVWMMPLFVRFNQHDALSAPLDKVDDAVFASWVEEMLLDYLDAYLRIDRGREDFDDESVTDPVCGMRIARSAAVAKDSYVGHPYFFCSEECRKAFAADPQAFVQVKTM
jgi:YHS domain-containing protein